MEARKIADLIIRKKGHRQTLQSSIKKRLFNLSSGISIRQGNAFCDISPQEQLIGTKAESDLWGNWVPYEDRESKETMTTDFDSYFSFTSAVLCPILKYQHLFRFGHEFKVYIFQLFHYTFK